MKHWLTLPPKRTALIVALLFLGVSLLFYGCSRDVRRVFFCDCYYKPDKPGAYNIQYLDCNGDIKSTKRDWTGLDPSNVQETPIDDCERLIKVSPVPTSE